MNPEIQTKSPPKRVKFIAWIFAAFFSTFIIVDIFYITLAEKTWRGLATEDGYQKGLKYNDTIEAVKTQKQLGWKLQINYQFEKTKTGILQVKLSTKNHQEIIDAQITANIKRPVQEGKDFSVDLKFDTKTQSYNSKVEFPMIGQWDVEIVARKNGNVYQDIKRLVVR
ncbi:MAG: FixH family protein [Pseudomonadota bacterium]